MTRYSGIVHVTFDSRELPLPVAASIGRRCEPLPAPGDAQRFVSSIQLAPAVLTAEVTIRGTAAAEGLVLGQCGPLSLTLGPTQAGQASRTVRLEGAVLHAIELSYAQQGLAQATLKFVAQSDAQQDPFTAG